MTFTRALSTNNYGPMKFIVDGTTTANATHSTIAAALTSASSGDTIFIRPGTYTENLTLKVGVNLCANTCDAFTPNVTIVGTCTLTAAGSVSISGIRLQTNSAALIAVTGSAASILNVNDCYLNCSNNTGITYSSSSTSSRIHITNCHGDLGTTGIGLYTGTGTGQININYSKISNSGASVTASSNSEGLVQFFDSSIAAPLSTTSAGAVNIFWSDVDPSTQNTTALTASGTGGGTILNGRIFSGTASAISIGAGVIYTISGAVVNSSNINAITGAGSLFYQNIIFSNSSSKINTTTQTGGVLIGGRTQAPSAGFLGEQIRATVAVGSGVTLTTNVGANVTSISLTAGIWDVSGIVGFNGTVTGTVFLGSISTSSASPGTDGDNSVQTPYPPTAGCNNNVTIPSFRITLTATTTVYLVAFSTFTVGTNKAYGRISGTRVG